MSVGQLTFEFRTWFLSCDDNIDQTDNFV